ncbi:MAG: hypothetical protein HY329_02365 [Chloroflexi bacterium]|nr:hypothetical protein [Chloroflexota bacterium]
MGQGRTDDVLTLLRRYATYVATREDATYGYIREYGHPMYLFYLAEMHRQLSQLTGEPQYRAKYLRAVDSIVTQAHELRWQQYAGDGQYLDPDPLYTGLFVEALLDAYHDTGDAKYRRTADGAMAALPAMLAPLDLDPVPKDDLVIIASAIALYADRTDSRDPALLAPAERIFRHVWSLHDPATGRWYYSADELRQGLYNGSSAYYQLSATLFLMHRSEHVRAVFPHHYARFRQALPTLLSTVESELLPSGGFSFEPDYPDYTESAAQVLWAFEIYDRAFATDHQELKDRIVANLQRLQHGDGSFSATPGSSTTGLMYSDAIGWALANWVAAQYPRLSPVPFRIALPVVGGNSDRPPESALVTRQPASHSPNVQ